MCFHLKIKSPSHNGRSEFTIDFNKYLYYNDATGMKAYQRKRGEFLMGAALILFLIPTALLWLGTGTVCIWRRGV